jgi:hypothetical protein
MKRIFVTVLAIGVSAGAGFPTAQAQPGTRYDPGTQTCRIITFENLQEGYRLFRSDCKNCHHRGNDQGADFLYTESKSMKGWNRVFASRYPECAKGGVWDRLGLEQLLKLNDYLFANAFDANNPHCAA